MSKYRINGVIVDNVKRIRHVEIRPDADKHIILIGGYNRQGKTSLLDAFRMALGGEKEVPVEPIHRGEEAGQVRLMLEDPDPTSEAMPLLVTRTFTKRDDGTVDSSLEVREDGVKARAQQTLLKKIIGTRFMDPLKFLELKAPEQREKLLEVIGEGERLSGLDKKREHAFDKRRELGRDLKSRQAQLDGLPAASDAPEADDISKITEEWTALQGQKEERGNLITRRDRAVDATDAARAEVDRLRKELQRAETHLDTCERAEKPLVDAYSKLPPAEDLEARIRELGGKMTEAQALSRRAAEADVAKRRRVELANEIAQLDAAIDQCNVAIDEIDRRKADILAAAKLPIAGLGIGAEGVTLNGLPLEQASGAERHRVAIALAIAAAPHLRDVWIRDGSLLDDESLAVLEEICVAAGVRCWIERVGVDDDGAIIIHDGGIVAAEDAPPPRAAKKVTRKK